MVKDLTISSLSKALNFYFWKKDIVSGKEFWSPGLFTLINLIPSEDLSIEKFINEYVHENDQHPLLEAVNLYLNTKKAFELNFRIKHQKLNYYWLSCKGNATVQDNLSPKSHFLIFTDINDKKKYKKRYNENKFFYQESAEMTRTGGWFIDFEHKKTYWDRGTRKILGIDKSVKQTLAQGLSFFPKKYRIKILKHFLDCHKNGFPFHTEVKLKTAKQREIWAIIIGKPMYNESGSINGIRGVLQDIYELKVKELSIKKSMDIITSQNSRLYNFAHIVSHNLRSHSSNLDLVTELIEETNDQNEKKELFNTVRAISDSLNLTIEHLNEVAAIHTLPNKKLETVSFSKTLNLVRASINQIITQENAIIESDFTEVDELLYIPSYLESILLNLITNSIKYKDENRNPHIKIKTKIINKQIQMQVSDNGIGIDLKSFGSNLFGMYQTFHGRKGAVGIGLFITKNQIESLNGSINVESEVGRGTTFTINF